VTSQVAPNLKFSGGSTLDPAGGAYSAPPDSLAVGEGLTAPANYPTFALDPSRLGFLFCLYLSIRGLRKGPGKFLMGVLESPGFFVSKRVGTLYSVSSSVETVA